jgi:hypothetical protein
MEPFRTTEYASFGGSLLATWALCSRCGHKSVQETMKVPARETLKDCA